MELRKIKFRGYGKQIGMWFYGCLDTLSIPSPRIMLKNSEGEVFSVEVIPETVGQFTGLHDKNGKEIYENDIIRSFDSTGQPIIHSICWCEPCAKFVAILDSDSKYGRTYCDLDKDWIDEFCKEVIGNIHDNMELLKTQN